MATCRPETQTFGASPETTLLRVTSGDQVETELKLVPGTLLRLVLLDSESRPVLGRIRVRDAEGHAVDGLGDEGARAEPRDAGYDSAELRLGPLLPGHYAIEAIGPAGERIEQELVLDGSARTRKVILRLR